MQIDQFITIYATSVTLVFLTAVVLWFSDLYISYVRSIQTQESVYYRNVYYSWQSCQSVSKYRARIGQCVEFSRH